MAAGKSSKRTSHLAQIKGLTESRTTTIDGVQFFLEPTSTALVVLEIASAAIQLLSLLTKKKIDDGINSPIATIIKRLDQIIEELRYIRKYLPIALDDAFRKRLVAEVKATADALSFLISDMRDADLGRIDRNSRLYGEIRELTLKQLNNAYLLREYGFQGYFAVASATMSFLTMCALLREKRSAVQDFESKIGHWFDACIDPAQADSAARVLEQIRDEEGTFRRTVNSFPRQVFLGSYQKTSALMIDPGDRPDRPERRTITIHCYATLQGDYDTPLSWQPFEDQPDAAHRGWPLIPSETDAYLHDHFISAQARCDNSLNGWAGYYGLNKYKNDGHALGSRAVELEVTISTIGELKAKLSEATKKFKK